MFVMNSHDADQNLQKFVNLICQEWGSQQRNQWRQCDAHRVDPQSDDSLVRYESKFVVLRGRCQKLLIVGHELVQSPFSKLQRDARRRSRPAVARFAWSGKLWLEEKMTVSLAACYRPLLMWKKLG